MFDCCRPGEQHECGLENARLFKEEQELAAELAIQQRRAGLARADSVSSTW
jgi:hypothetical protein